jgi:ABC-2 type transport system ATP-binding protein
MGGSRFGRRCRRAKVSALDPGAAESVAFTPHCREVLAESAQHKHARRSIRTQPVNQTPALSVQRVFKTFAEVRAVSGVEFEIRPGEVFGFLGPNGAGKTTTLRMIMGITVPDQGSILFDGQPRIDRQSVGYLPEERGLFEDAPVLDVLGYFGSLRGMRLGAAQEAGRVWLERLGLADRARSKVGALSKGNQQKVQFAGAVLHRPRLVALDEPFAGLDPLNQELFLRLIAELRSEGAAVLLSAHQLGLVERLCDRFYLISRGRGVLAGTLDEIRRQAAGGVRDLLTVELRCAPGTNGTASIRAAVDSVSPPTEMEVHEYSPGKIRANVSVLPGIDLGPMLTAFARLGTIETVQMRPLSLHEIYLRVVGDESVPDKSAPVHDELIHA